MSVMQNFKPHQLQAAQGGRFPVAWCPSRPQHPVRAHQRNVQHSAALRDTVCELDLIQWPEGARPRRGGVTKASLTRLKVAELRAELQRLGADASGTKEQLAEKLLQIVNGKATAATVTATPTQPAQKTGALSEHNTSQHEDELQQQQHHQGEEDVGAHAAAACAVKKTRRLCSGTSRAAAPPDQLGQLQTSSSSDLPAEQEGHQQHQHRQSPQQPANSRAEGPSATTEQQWLSGLIPPQGGVAPVDPAEAARIAAAVGVDLADLPPLAEKSRGQVYDVEGLSGLTAYELEMVLKANRSGLILTLLGGAYGSAAVAGECAAPCLALLREKDIWLFDCGEDIQRSVLWREHIRPSKLHRIVITRQTPDSLLGLPGVLCVLGASREKGHEVADIPIHVYAPQGTAALLSTMYECSNTFLEMPVVVHEFVTYAVREEEMQPHPLNKRAKLFRALMPPDQLNPHGWINGAIDAFMPTQGRARVRKGGRASGGVLAVNPRAGYRSFNTPPPGNPELRDLAPSSMTWTVVADEAAMMTAVLCEAEAPSWAVVWHEADKQGNLNMQRCEALGVHDNNLYKDIKSGEAVVNENGVTIPAGMLCSSDKPGRKVVLLPPCTSAAGLAPFAAGADVMFGDAAAAVGAAAGPGSSPGLQQQQLQQPLGAGLGVIAEDWGVRHLVITGLPGRPDISSSSKSRSPSNSSKSHGNSRDSTSSTEAADVSKGTQAAAAAQQRMDPAVSALLEIVSRQYTAGQIMPGRDDMSLVVEENLGHLPAAEVDFDEKAAAARTTTLNVLTIPPPVMTQQQREKDRRFQERRQSERRGPSQQRRGGSTYIPNNRYRAQQQQQQPGYRQNRHQVRKQHEDGVGSRQVQWSSEGVGMHQQQRGHIQGDRAAQPQQVWQQQEHQGTWHRRGPQQRQQHGTENLP